MLSLFLAYTVLGTACYFDIRYRRIPNWLTFPCMLAGILMCLFPFSGEAFSRLLGIFGLYFFGMLGLMGMGDLKLCMAILCIRGFDEMFAMVFYAALILFAFCCITDFSGMKDALVRVKNFFVYKTPIAQSKKTYPFAVFLCLGFLTNRILCSMGVFIF